jgi:hypothetical protein
LASSPEHARLGSSCLSLSRCRGTPMIPLDTHLQIGSLLFEGLDQIDLTGPFEVLSRGRGETVAKSLDSSPT